MRTDFGRELSKAISHALRHEPWLYELELDDEGWASTESILAALSKERLEWANLDEADLTRMIESSSKRRHEIKNGRIRSIYGHSIAGKLKRTPAIPPGILYHGTAPDVIALIESSGLLPMSRQHVHLSVDEATALEVAHRKASNPALLRVLAGKACADGIKGTKGDAALFASHSFLNGTRKELRPLFLSKKLYWMSEARMFRVRFWKL